MAGRCKNAMLPVWIAWHRPNQQAPWREVAKGDWLACWLALQALPRDDASEVMILETGRRPEQARAQASYGAHGSRVERALPGR